MNDRIRQLAEQATKQYSPTYYTQEWIQGFAELIAQESIVDFYRRYLDICSEEDITVQVERYVKEHYGVKE
jgi:hypothetical protein